MDDKIVIQFYKEGATFAWASWHHRFSFGNREKSNMQQPVCNI
jgi:hypothetical protein